jgi:CRISPR system Cascade subunit CasE
MSTWLTQITPDFRDAHARKDASDAVRMHQRVMHLVPDGLGDQARLKAGVLYRVEETARGVQILVQTQLEPDPARLPAGYGAARVRELDSLLRWLRPGAMVRYRLAANTCLRKSQDKKVLPLRGANADQWWITRAPAAGLDLRSLISKSPGDAVGRPESRSGITSANRVRHAVTQFDGVAAVTDPAALASAIITGVGRGKSHGCGLLSIAPLGAAA